MTLSEYLSCDGCGSHRIPCPVHGGDGNNCLINFDMNCWRCFSYNCHDEVGGTLWALSKYLGCDLTSQKERSPHRHKKEWHEKVLNKKLIPVGADTKYFVGRGFKASTARAFKGFTSHNNRSPLYKRAIIPIFNDLGDLVGFTGRSIVRSAAKWKHHPKGFAKNRYFYNLGIAKSHIVKNTIIIVEGPFDVWRLYEYNIFNAVSSLGTGISEFHVELLEKYDIRNIILILDPDDAGQQNTLDESKMGGKLSEKFNVYSLRHLIKTDVGELSPKEMKVLKNGIDQIYSQL